jgi:tagatose 1,6-diphosphate aldolase GatY/KbaY
VSVEAELGMLAGKEDNISSAESSYTDPAEAVRFVAETGVDSLALAVGTAHGIYKTKPVLNAELISRIRGLLKDTPLVLHGASGLTDGCIRDCVRRGMAKVNFATELRVAFTGAVTDYIGAKKDVIDPKKYLEPARAAVYEAVKKRIAVLGCAGAAL